MCSGLDRGQFFVCRHIQKIARNLLLLLWLLSVGCGWADLQTLQHGSAQKTDRQTGRPAEQCGWLVRLRRLWLCWVWWPLIPVECILALLFRCCAHCVRTNLKQFSLQLQQLLQFAVAAIVSLRVWTPRGFVYARFMRGIKCRKPLKPPSDTNSSDVPRLWIRWPFSRKVSGAL